MCGCSPLAKARKTLCANPCNPKGKPHLRGSCTRASRPSFIRISRFNFEQKRAFGFLIYEKIVGLLEKCLAEGSVLVMRIEQRCWPHYLLEASVNAPRSH